LGLGVFGFEEANPIAIGLMTRLGLLQGLLIFKVMTAAAAGAPVVMERARSITQV
jgi:hypothetical protein